VCLSEGCVCVSCVSLDFSHTQAMQDAVSAIFAREPVEAFLNEVKASCFGYSKISTYMCIYKHRE
jgi:hypothetical protein